MECKFIISEAPELECRKISQAEKEKCSQQLTWAERRYSGADLTRTSYFKVLVVYEGDRSTHATTRLVTIFSQNKKIKQLTSGQLRDETLNVFLLQA